MLQLHLCNSITLQYLFFFCLSIFHAAVKVHTLDEGISHCVEVMKTVNNTEVSKIKDS